MNNYYDVQESGKRIKKLREERGYSQDYVAGCLGITKNAYQKLERGANGAKIETLIDIAEMFDTTLDYIVIGKRNETVEDMIGNLDEKEREFILNQVKSMMEGFKQFKS